MPACLSLIKPKISKMICKPAIDQEKNMNIKEELTKSYIAMCKCCLLAQAMKDCPMCRFNIGLTRLVNPVDFPQVQCQPQIVIFALSDAS
jgi:hypothetical protein